MTLTISLSHPELPTGVFALGPAASEERLWLETREPRTPEVAWGQRVHLSRLWHDLCLLRRESVLVFSSERHWRVLLEIPSGDAKRLPDDKQQLVRQCLTGVSQKSIAHSRQRSVSAVCSKFSAALTSIGLTGDWRRALVLFTTAINAAETCAPLYADAQDIGWRQRAWRAFTAEKPDLFGPEVCRAEAAVGRLFVTGYSYAQIARARGVSVRTIANQVGALFRKYGVSGRAELIQHLVVRRLQGAH